MGDHIVRHLVGGVVPAARVVARAEGARPMTRAPLVATSSSTIGSLTGFGSKYQS